MNTVPQPHPSLPEVSAAPRLQRLAKYRGLRALFWANDVLYASRGYEIIRQRFGVPDWQPVTSFRPAWWRGLTSRSALTLRLMRDGFHAITVLHDGTMIGAVPGAIVTSSGVGDGFRVTHRILSGTRPLHITTVPSGTIYWGEYFDNRNREQVHIYASTDRGSTWQVAYTFPPRAIRHVHNIVYDHFADCFWILTGDEGDECNLLRSSCDFRSIETVLSGTQQARAVAAIPTAEWLYLSTDTPQEKNHIYRLNRGGTLESVADLNASSISGCRVGEALFFSTMVEPSAVNTDREVHLVGSSDGAHWQSAARWKKDRFSMKYFQYGNAFLPDGHNTTGVLAVTTVAVEQDDCTTTLWQVDPAS